MTQTIEQILELAKAESTKVVDHDLLGNPITDADVLLMSAYGPLIIRIANAAIQHYKENALKEVGEPVASTVSEGIAWTEYGLELPNNIKLFTSDQVAAAVLKATKPLEEEIERLNRQVDNFNELDRKLEAKASMDLTSMPDAICELRQQLKAAQEEIVYASKDSLRLLETVKYLRGIAERGEARQQSEDETVEQFVLGYVKKLEDQLAKAEQRVAEAIAALADYFEQKADDLNDSISNDDDHNEGRSEYIMGKASASSRMAKSIRSGEYRKYMKGE